MIAKKPPMGWNSWNTFGDKINEQLIKEMTDRIVEDGYRDLGYEYVIIDDCWSLRERVDGKLVADPALFPNGMKALADYIHSKGLKFGMYSCAGTKTCAGYPSSYGHEFSDAKQFAEWGVDYLKYDFCNFPVSGDAKNAYLTMAMALRSTGRDILFAACVGGALITAMVISSIVGTVIPMFFHKIHVDPAVASGPLITTVNDLVAVITYYGLSLIILIDMFHIVG